EQRHHRVADELLHRAAEALQLRAQTLVIRTQDRGHVLRIELLRPRCEADQIGEQHRHDFPLLPRLAHAVAASNASPSRTYRVAPTERQNASACASCTSASTRRPSRTSCSAARRRATPSYGRAPMLA